MTDEIWYYADRQRQNRGPFTAAAIAALFRKGELNAETLVWQQSMSEWQPLSQFASEFGLATSEMDPGFTLPLNSLPPATSPPRLDDVRPVYPIYAGFWRRFAALFIDRFVIVFILIVIAVLVAMLAMFVGQAKAQSSSENAVAAGIQAAVWLGYLVIAPFYYALQESSVHQATLGKRAMGIKVTDLDGKRIGFAHALGRWAAASISYLTFYIGFIMAGFTERKQALHDMIAGTLVVDRVAFTSTPNQQRSGNSGCLIAAIVGACLAIPMFAILAAIAISQYQDYVVRAQVSEGMVIADGLKAQVNDAYSRTGKCPSNGEEGFNAPDDYAGRFVASATLGELTSGNCAIEIRFGGAKVNGQIAGKSLQFQASHSGGNLEWTCGSDTIKNKNLPTSCRSSAGGS